MFSLSKRFAAILVCAVVGPIGFFAPSVAQASSPGVRLVLPTWTVGFLSTGSVSVTVSADPTGGVKVPTNASGASVKLVSALPAGISAAWTKPTVTSAGAVQWTLTFTGSTAALASSETLTVSSSITNSSNGKVYSTSGPMAVKVVFVAPTLSISPALTHVPVQQGTTVTDLFSIKTGGSFHGPVTLGVSGLPAGVTAAWSNSSVTPNAGSGSSILSLSASSSATVNWFGFTVTASGDGLSKSLKYVVEVEPSVGLSLSLSQSSLAIRPGATAALNVTATPIHGVIVQPGAAGAKMAVTSNLPSGIAASWSKPTLTSTGAVNWTLTLTAASTAAAGSDPFHISGQIVDKTSGMTFSAGQDFPLLVSILATVNVGSTPGQAIPTTFMGLSHEWGDAQRIMGSESTGVNKIYRQLLANLTAYGPGPIILRIGGDSTDTRGEPTSTVVEPFAEVAQAAGVRFYLGINLGSDNVNLAVDQATAYLKQMPAGSIKAFEIGNEPDMYVQLGYRPAGYSFQDYYADFTTWSQHISPLLPSGMNLMGASWAKFYPASTVGSFQSTQTGNLSDFSQHFYVTTPSTLPSYDYLLTQTAAISGPSQAESAIALTHTNGLPYRMGETNSITDAGVQGVSNAFGSALWSMDTMFEYASRGADGVNWEASDGNANNPFTFTTTTSNGITKFALQSVSPLYYGLVLFQHATANNSRLLPVDLSTPANLKAWSTLDASGNTRLLLINKDEKSSGVVTVTAEGFSQATVLRLLAPSYKSTSGVTLGGQTFDGSPDGTLQGTPANETIEGNNGVFQIPIAVTSAALISFSN